MSAQPNDFRYYLTLDNERKEILFAPDGWDSNTILSYKRSEVYMGLIRGMALPMQFVYDGADILRKAYYTYGIEANVKFEVEQLQKSLNLGSVWPYKLFAKGDIDFSEFDDSDNHVSVALMESGISRNIKAYEGVKYQYPLTGDDVVNVILPGVAFSEESTSIFQPSGEELQRYIPASDIATEAFKSGFVEVKNVAQQEVNDNSFATSDNWFVKANRQVEIKLTGNMNGMFVSITGSPGHRIEIKNNANVVRATLYVGINKLGVIPFDFPIEQTISLDAEEKLFFYLRVDGIGNDQEILLYSGDFKVSYNSVSDPSNCKGIPAPAMYKRLINKISPGSACDSRLLGVKWPNLIFTSGDGIREIVDAKIKITFKEFFETINGIDDAAFGLENGVAVLENADYFFRKAKIVDLGEVKDCSIQPAQDFLFNSIKIGYSDGNTDDTDGKEEYNSTQIWQLPITRVQKERNWISPTRADQYGIEKIRVDYNIKSEKNKNDTASDNNPFMFYTYQDGANYRPVLGSTYDSVTGLENGNSAYNLELTPKQNLLRKQGYLAGVMDRMPGRYINFASGEKNTEVITVKDGKRVKENENILTSSLTGKYFIPNIASIVTKMPRNTMWIMDNMMFGFIQFTYRGVVLKGYLMDVPIDVARNTEQTLKLLLTDGNNLLNLA